MPTAKSSSNDLQGLRPCRYNVKPVERELAKCNGFIGERDDAENFALDEVEESVFDAITSMN